MIGIYHRSNFVTFIGIAVAAGGLALAVAGQARWGMACLVVCGVCDLFDGRYARSFARDERQQAYGIQLDSLADVAAFGALPAVLLFTLAGPGLAACAVAAAYLLAVINRLAYFNLQAEAAGADQVIAVYRGLPVTYAALVLPTAWLAGQWLAPAWAGLIHIICSLLLAGLYVVDIPVPKPKALGYALFSLAALLLLIGIVWL